MTTRNEPWEIIAQHMRNSPVYDPATYPEKVDVWARALIIALNAQGYHIAHVSSAWEGERAHRTEQRAYTIDEIDAMREMIIKREEGRECLKPGGGGFTPGRTLEKRSEDMLRTYMTAGLGVEEIKPSCDAMAERVEAYWKIYEPDPD